MGFPTWTLWGMGAAAFGALVAIALALLAQSPRWLNRLNLTGQRLDLRAKSFTGYGFALLLLAIGFYLAGVPLGQQPAAEGQGDSGGPTAVPMIASTTTASGGAGQSGAMVGLPTATTAAGGASGAMAGLITPQPTLEAGVAISGTAVITPTIAPTAAPGETPLPTATPTLFPTATPPPTPSPTPSPTPILVDTALIGDGTSTLPVRRLPGGPVLVVLVRGDTVIPLSGHAFYEGDLWREIQTVAGVIGWVPDEFVDYSAE